MKMKNETGLYPVRTNFGKIALPSANGLVFCHCNEIIYCKAEGSYTKIKLEIGNTLLISRTLKSFNDILEGQSFVRIHNSYLINLHFIEAYVKSAGGYVVLKGGEEISIARNRKKTFLEAISMMML